MPEIFHIARQTDWEAAVDAGTYRESTLGRTLEQEGFIHCSQRQQVAGVANAFYRDVPPGHYHIAPQSFGRDFNQDKDVDLTPGQQLFVKIVSLESWGVSVSGSRKIQRDTFYAWLIPQEVAQVEIARDRSGI